MAPALFCLGLLKVLDLHLQVGGLSLFLVQLILEICHPLARKQMSLQKNLHSDAPGLAHVGHGCEAQDGLQSLLLRRSGAGHQLFHLFLLPLDRCQERARIFSLWVMHFEKCLVSTSEPSSKTHFGFFWRLELSGCWFSHSSVAPSSSWLSFQDQFASLLQRPPLFHPPLHAMTASKFLSRDAARCFARPSPPPPPHRKHLHSVRTCAACFGMLLGCLVWEPHCTWTHGTCSFTRGSATFWKARSQVLASAFILPGPQACGQSACNMKRRNSEDFGATHEATRLSVHTTL